MLTAADQWIEVRTPDVGASLEGKKSQRFIFSRLVTLRSLIFSQLASAALKWILISALMQTCQINFADLGYDWPKIASASVLCSKPMNFNHGQNGLVAFFVRNLNRKGLNCKCQGMMLFCSFQKLMWWRSKKLLCRVYSWQVLWEALLAGFPQSWRSLHKPVRLDNCSWRRHSSWEACTGCHTGLLCPTWLLLYRGLRHFCHLGETEAQIPCCSSCLGSPFAFP